MIQIKILNNKCLSNNMVNKSINYQDRKIIIKNQIFKNKGIRIIKVLKWKNKHDLMFLFYLFNTLNVSINLSHLIKYSQHKIINFTNISIYYLTINTFKSIKNHIDNKIMMNFKFF